MWNSGSCRISAITPRTFFSITAVSVKLTGGAGVVHVVDQRLARAGRHARGDAEHGEQLVDDLVGAGRVVVEDLLRRRA